MRFINERRKTSFAEISPRALASVLGCVVTLQLGAFSVVLETTLSGITALFPVAGYQLAGLPMRLCFQKLRMVLPLVCAVGLLNPLFDRQIVVQVGTLAVSGGVLSMLTLILKGVFCLLASFLLMATTTIEAICRALRQLHVPKLLTNLLLLTFRYVGLLLSEVAVMQQAYSLRAPGQKGIHISAWGSFLGQLLLRSMRSTRVWSCAGSAANSPALCADEARRRRGRMHSCVRR